MNHDECLGGRRGPVRRRVPYSPRVSPPSSAAARRGTRTAGSIAPIVNGPDRQWPRSSMAPIVNGPDRQWPRSSMAPIVTSRPFQPAGEERDKLLVTRPGVAATHLDETSRELPIEEHVRQKIGLFFPLGDVTHHARDHA